jgi:DNA-directed RNA polymerase subunit RPC12/RpoP
MTITGFCMKCGKENKENGKNKAMKNAKMNMTSRGGYMAKGQCPDCGTTLCAIMSKDNALKAIESGDAEKAF